MADVPANDKQAFQDMASKLVREQVERTRQRASQASLVVRDLSDRGLFPGVYAQELELFRANNRKTWFSAAGVGLGIYLGLFPVIPRRWMTRVALASTGMTLQLSIGGVLFLYSTVLETTKLDHSLVADVLCPAIIEVSELGKQRQRLYNMPASPSIMECAQNCRQREVRRALAGRPHGLVHQSLSNGEMHSDSGTTSQLVDGASWGHSGGWNDSEDPWEAKNSKK